VALRCCPLEKEPQKGGILWGFFISSLNHRCGLVGFWGVPDAALRTYYALFALQHRGQESAGIVASDRSEIQSKKGLGLVSEALDRNEVAAMPGDIALGHVRYSTTGAKRVQNIQPLVIEYSQGIVAVAHNGNLTNARRLRHRFESRGSIFQTSTDSEVFVHLMADPAHLSTEDPLADALTEVHGAFSIGMLTCDQLIAARDPLGFRPLSIASLEGGYMIASETCAFDLFEAEHIRDVAPGEVVTFSDEGMTCKQFAPEGTSGAQCIFEHIYFARPDSHLFDRNVHQVRRRLGERLAREHPVEADVVTAIPDSGNSAAMGFAAAAGIPLERGFIRNYYVGRTFIMPGERESSVELKLNPVKDVLSGKRVVVVDDSIVRGTTSRARIAALRKAGARELHFRISAPPIRHGCYFGIDFPDPAKLIANERTVDEIRDFLEVDSLGYISVDGLLDAVGGTREEYCTACFTGDYPCRVEDADMDKHAMERRK
jgi:amidophosphoribosyltransferase